ncbi:hypothetical protein J6590_099205, partial [Homalodisca vitripennis]
MALSKKTVAEPHAETDKHELVHVPRRGTRVCSVSKKRISWYCPECNCGSQCFSLKRPKTLEDSGVS